MSDVIGTASILVTADGSDFSKSMQKLNGTIESVADKAGKNAGAALSDSVGKVAGKAIGSVGRIVGQQLEKAVVPATQVAGQKAQSAFSKGLAGIVGTANTSAARVGDTLKSKIVGAATAAAQNVSSTFQNLVPSGVGRAAESAGNAFKARLSSATDKAARMASSNVGGVLISGMAKVAERANSAFQSGFKIAGAALKEAGRAVGEASKKLASGLSAGAKKAGEAAGKMLAVGLKATAVGALAAVSAVATGVLVKGFGRLTNIDTATKKLNGLGIEGERLELVMDNALRAVEGTAFGLDEAAMAAGQFAAAGIKPGGPMESALKGLANVSAVAGRSMADMSGVFTDAAAQGKITGDTLMRLEQSGIAASQMMADEMGISVDELRKKVSAGQVSFEEFSATIEGPLGKAAAIMGTSFKGMVANIGAAMGRVGAKALTPVFEGLKSVMPNVIELFNRLGTALQPFIDKIAPHITAFFGWLGGALDGINFGAATEGASGFADTLLNISTNIQDWFMKALTGLPDLLTDLLPKMADAMISKLSFMLKAAASIVNAVSNALVTYLPLLVQKFLTFIPMFTTQLQTLLPLLLAAIMQMVVAMANSLPTLIPLLIQAGITLFQSLVSSLLSLAVPLLEGLMSVLGSVVEAIINSAPLLFENALTFFLMLVEAVLDMLPTLVRTLLDLVGPIVRAVLKMVPDLLDAAVDLFMMLVDAVVDILPTLLTTIVGLIPDIIKAVISLIPKLLDAAINLFTALVNSIPIILPQILKAITDLLPFLVKTVIQLIPTLLNAAITLFLAIVEALPVIIPELISAVLGLIPVIVKTLIDAIPQLYQAGKDVIQGLLNGMGSMLKTVGKFFLDKLPGWIKGAFKKALGIKSPSTVFEGYGHNIIRGLVSGLDGSAKEAENSIERIAAKIMDSKLSDGSKSKMVKYVTSQGAALTRLLDQTDVTMDQLKDQMRNLEDMEKTRADLIGRISSKLSGEFDLGDSIDTDKETKEKSTSFEAIAANVKAIAARVKVFAGKLKDLLQKGYPNALINEVAALGSQEGILVANALLSATSAQQGDFLNDYVSLGSFSDQAGAALADDLYQVGIDAQAGLVQGLLAENAGLEAAAKKISDNLTSYVAKNLGIKSPSRVFKSLGVHVGEGLAQGLASMAKPVEKAMDKMMAATNPDTSVNLSSASSGSLGTLPRTAAMRAMSATGTTSTSTVGDTHVTVRVDMKDLAQLKDLEQFLKMVRVRSRMGVGEA